MNSDLLQIRGGKPLQGKIVAAGAKNAMTKLLVASLLSDQKCIFYNVPNIGDVSITVDLLKEIGSEIHWDKEKKILEIQTKEIRTAYIPQRFSGSNRIPILMIGALLGRAKEDIIVPTLGGDLLGNRPLDFHILSLQKLGATIEYRQMKKEGAYFAQAHKGLIGALIEMPYPSVGATENTILAAILAKGTTVIKNAAIEPEIMDLIMFLQKMGASISLEHDRTIRIDQAQKFKEVEHTVLVDRNEIASYAMAAISTRGRVFIEGAQQRDLIALLTKLRTIGADFNITSQGIEFFATKELKGNVHIETEVHPGFMTDWQPPLGVLLTQCKGASIIHETVYENRLGYIQALKEMGAQADLFTTCLGDKKCRFSGLNHNHSVIIYGPSNLQAKEISIPDLRAGFAYVMAALLIEDTTIIHGAHFLDRGYEDFMNKLTSLGASIERVQKNAPNEIEKLLKKKENIKESSKV
jgi:UDP-N-acetylglucosamine 1-carboxyvinyltransferase